MKSLANKQDIEPITLRLAVEAFLRELEGKNRSAATVVAYRTDLSQFVSWLLENNLLMESPEDVERADISEYLSYLGERRLTGLSRARKLAAIREYFRFLEGRGFIDRSPALGIDTPKREKHSRNYLHPDEYNRILSLAGAHPRDYAIFQVFLQTGVRVSELCDLKLSDIDLAAHTLKIRGKGQVEREIDLEKKGIQAIRNYLNVRIGAELDRLFLNRYGDPIGERGVKKLVAKYCQLAGITKRVSCHSLRHTFATYKAQQGVSPFQLKEWLGHANLNTTQIYVHLARQNGRKVMEATSL